MQTEIFAVDGYFKDDPESFFFDFLICSYDDTPEGYSDVVIFFYGLSEEEIKEAIQLKENTVHDFVLTDYRRI